MIRRRLVLVVALSQMHGLEHERFLDQNGLLVVPGILPAGYVEVVLVVALGLALGSLHLDPEVTAARLVAVQTVAGHQLAQFEEVGQPERLLELLIELLVGTRNTDVGPELLAKRLNLDDRLLEALLRTAMPTFSHMM